MFDKTDNHMQPNKIDLTNVNKYSDNNTSLSIDIGQINKNQNCKNNDISKQKQVLNYE